MTPQRWKQIGDLYYEASLRPEGERGAFLLRACDDDEEMRREVESLLGSEENVRSFIESSPDDVAAGMILARDQARSMVGLSLGRYQLHSLIGKGGMGEVYQAADTRLDRRVAVKILPEHLASNSDALRRFEREARAVAALSHPNILSIHDLGQENGVTYAVMELLEGETLRVRLQQRPLDWHKALEVIIAVAEGLEAAHAAGIVHRDLKPANIFLTSSGQVKVLDFGIARVKRLMSPETETAQSTLTDDTRPGTVLGTVGYMSPEQVRGEEADAPSDLFSLGCVLYEMLAGKAPFARGNTIETMAAILDDEPPKLATTNKSVPKELERVIRHCLEKQADKRYQSARELADDLRAVLGGGWHSLKAPAVGLRKPGPIAALVLVTLLGSAYFVWQFKKGARVADEAIGVLVLPAKVFGAPEFSYLTDAIPGTLSTYLAQVKGLDTKVPPSSIEFERVQGDITRAASLYGVKKCVISSVTADGDRIVLNVQLVEPISRTMQWSREFEGRRGNYIEMARQAADGIRRVLRPNTSPVSSTAMHAANSEAELAFRQGQHFWNRYNNQHQPKDFDLALDSLKEALKHDPQLAEAAAEIAFLYIFKWEAGGQADELLPQVEFWSNRALAIDPQNGRGWAVRTWSAQWAKDYEKSLEYALKAAFYGPQDAMAQTALTGPVLADELSLATSREAHRLDPLYLSALTNLGLALLYMGRASEGLTMADEALRLEPGMPGGISVRTLCLIELNLDEAADSIKKLEMVAKENRLPQFALWLPKHSLALKLGNTHEADMLLKDILSDPRVIETEPAAIYYDVAPYLAMYGKKELALDLLNRVLDSGCPLRYDHLMFDQRLSSLRGEPEFQKILSRTRAQFDKTLKIILAARERGELPLYLETAVNNLLTKLGMKPG